MPEFLRVETPPPNFVDGKPTTCLGCSTHRHPDGFIDLLIRDGVTSSWICAGCVEALGRLIGMVPAAALAEVKADAADKQADIDRLVNDLVVERESKFKVVALDDVRQLVKPVPQHPRPKTAA